MVTSASGARRDHIGRDREHFGSGHRALSASDDIEERRTRRERSRDRARSQSSEFVVKRHAHKCAGTGEDCRTVKNPGVTIDPSLRAIFLQFVGVVSLETFLTGRETLQKEPGWSPHYAHVFDFTRVTDLALSAADIKALASAQPIFDKHSPQILVARHGSFEFGLARTFGVYAEQRRTVHVVTSMDAARTLLATLSF